jgi:hypothetical protein
MRGAHGFRVDPGIVTPGIDPEKQVSKEREQVRRSPVFSGRTRLSGRLIRYIFHFQGQVSATPEQGWNHEFYGNVGVR